MAIPDFQTIMLPLLQLCQDEQEYSNRAAIETLADTFQLSEAERKELLPSGRQSCFDNRVSWSLSHLKKARLLANTRRGYFKITERGQTLLKQAPPKITTKLLTQYAEFKQSINQSDEPNQMDKIDTHSTPKEQMDVAYQLLRKELINELLQNIKSMSPSFFEHLVVDLLVQMGYGGSYKDAGQAIGRSGDEGIDGIIKQDRLGLDIVYIQAKRWENVISRPEIQKFAGALQGKRGKKGIFITTSSFSDGAKQYVVDIDNKIVLIDGTLLAELMIDYNIGVTPIDKYEIKRFDSDYFTES